MTRNLAFEWRRAASLRSTWGFPLLGVALTVMFAVLILAFAQGAGSAETSMRTVLGNAANPVGVVLITTICAQAFGHDYRDGTMRLVLSEFPVRSRVFLAKLLIPAPLVAASLLLATVLLAIVAPFFGNMVAGGSTASLVALSVRQVVQAVWWGLMVAALTALLRNLAAGIVIALAMAGILEGLLVAVIGDQLPWLAKSLPFMNAGEWASTGGMRPGLVMLTWAVLLVASAWGLFVKRDA